MTEGGQMHFCPSPSASILTRSGIVLLLVFKLTMEWGQYQAEKLKGKRQTNISYYASLLGIIKYRAARSAEKAPLTAHLGERY